MWSHYGGNHKGVAYGFDISESKRHTLLKIQYKEKLEPFNNRDLKCEETQKKETRYASRTKSNHWQYEDEWRIYCSLNAVEQYQKSMGRKLFYVYFSADLILREVIIGAESDITESQVRSALHEKHEIDVRKAVLSTTEYKIVTPPPKTRT